MKTLLAVLLLSTSALLFPAKAEAQHSATLTWAASPDQQTGMTYNVKRASGACATPLQTLTVIGTTGTLTFADTTPAPGVYCYAVTASLNGAESQPATATATVPLAGVVTLVVVGK